MSNSTRILISGGSVYKKHCEFAGDSVTWLSDLIISVDHKSDTVPLPEDEKIDRPKQFPYSRIRPASEALPLSLRSFSVDYSGAFGDGVHLNFEDKYYCPGNLRLLPNTAYIFPIATLFSSVRVCPIQLQAPLSSC
jgi:hypothetical protein